MVILERQRTILLEKSNDEISVFNKEDIYVKYVANNDSVGIFSIEDNIQEASFNAGAVTSFTDKDDAPVSITTSQALALSISNAIVL
jgi:hypothetical protein